VLRSLAYGLLDREGDKNPAKADLPADQPGRHNLQLLKKIRAEWQLGKASAAASTELLQTLRAASPNAASEKVVELLNGGIGPQSIWDGLFNAAGELLMRRPGIQSLHALTSANAIHFAFQKSGNDESRRLLLLQTAAFLPLFRGSGDKLKTVHIDQLQPANGERDKQEALEDIFAEVSRDRMSAASKVLAYLKQNPRPQEFVNAARRLVFLKGTNSHDYKFSSAVLEDYQNLSSEWRDRFLAASVFNLRGSGDKDNQLVKRTRAALG